MDKQAQGNSRPNNFYDAMEDGKKSDEDKSKREDVVSAASVTDVQGDTRPQVSTIVLDEATGIERIQQGQFVMDVATRKAVQLSDLGPMYRLAQMFPGVPPEIREMHRMDKNTIEVPDMIDRFRKVSIAQRSAEDAQKYMLELLGVC